MRKWLIDYDSTLADTGRMRIDAINEHFGTSFTSGIFTQWNNTGYLTNEQDAWSWGDECFLNIDLQADAYPMPHAIDAMQRMIEEGEQMMIVSDRPPSLFEVTRDWLDRQGLDTIRLLFTKHKHSKSGDVKGALTKLQAAYLYKLNYVVEDAPHHSVNLANKDYIEKVYLLTMPYNQGIEHEKITRVNDWTEIEY